jgi:hypothetical protein
VDEETGQPVLPSPESPTEAWRLFTEPTLAGRLLEIMEKHPDFGKENLGQHPLLYLDLSYRHCYSFCFSEFLSEVSVYNF